MVVEEVLAGAGLAAAVVLLAIGLVWRRVTARLVRASAELDRRHAVDTADQTAFDVRRRQIEAVLEARDTMRIVFQPIFDLVDERVIGHEALARFAGERTPDVWFAEAHAVGLGVELELLAITEAVGTFDAAAGYLAVNVSPAALRTPALQNFLRQSPDADRLVLELTEHAVIDDYESIAVCIKDLRALGTRLAVDDAGSGFASMRHIIDLAPDIVKLDRSIVDHVDCDPAREALVRSLVRFSADIGAAVVAEGIERDEELAACRELGVTAGQGYLLGRPASAQHPATAA